MTRRIAALVFTLTLAVACLHDGEAQWLGAPKSIAPGVDLFQTTDTTLVSPPAPIAVYLLRLDPDRVVVETALSNDEVMEAERVEGIARRRNALAAVNAGFFNVKNGEPAGVLKIAGELVSDTALTRGALAIDTEPGGRQRFYFDQASAKVVAHFRADTQDVIVPVDGVDTTRERGKLMLYTPAYHADTDTAANGTEWILDGKPLKVVDIRKDLGKTTIPRAGAVLSFGGLELTSPLEWLLPGTTVTFETRWKVLNGTPVEHFEQARDVVSGAGLLIRDGVTISEWLKTENLQPATFTDVRHPRTLVGIDRKGMLWLVTIDGRQPEYSVGMTFAELLTLCARLELTNALNLDGGGSTTMVVGGAVVNKPSDVTGPRAVSDAIVVRRR
jgi:exopolysaccharide biosynthesis protein